VVFDGDVEEVSAWGPLGQFGILAEHINFITSLVPGVLEARLADSSIKRWVVSGGLAEVKDGVLTVLASGAESPETIDRAGAAAEEHDAEQRSATVSTYDLEYAGIHERLMLARARVQATSSPNPSAR
jgi:F-type H+-transporting ATPase subunit epsilon